MGVVGARAKARGVRAGWLPRSPPQPGCPFTLQRLSTPDTGAAVPASISTPEGCGSG